MGAIRALQDDHNPDGLALAGHGIRELMSAAASAFDVPFQAQSEGLGKKVDELAVVWSKFVAERDRRGGTQEQSSLIRLLAAVERLFEWRRKHNPRRRKEAGLLLRRLDPSGRSVAGHLESGEVGRWMELRDFFVGVAHHGKRPERQEFLSRLDEFERFLLARLSPNTFSEQVAIARLIDEGEANGKEPESVRAAKPLIGRLAANYEYFFDRLSSPAWIAPLVAEGFFKEPPEPLTEGDSTSFPFWPESRYLARVARLAPELVLQTALQVPLGENIRVHEDLAQAALALPVPLACRWVRRELAWLRAQPVLFFMLPSHLADVVVHLAAGDKANDGLALFRELVRVQPDPRFEDHKGESLPWPLSPQPRPRSEEWQFEAALNRCVPALARVDLPGVAAVLRDALMEAIRLSARQGEDNGVKDYSAIWRPAIEDHPQNPGHDLKESLLVALRDVLERWVAGKPAEIRRVETLLAKGNSQVFTRLMLHLLRRFPDADSRLLEESLTKAVWLQDVGVRHEYFLLSQEAYPRLPAEAQSAVLRVIASGPDLQQYREGFQEREGRTPSNEEEKEIRDYWEWCCLTPIATSLHGDWMSRHKVLEQRFGPAAHPEFPYYSSSAWVGSSGPLSTDEMREMTTERLVEFLRTWIPEKGLRQHTIEGLGRVFASVVTGDCERYSSAALQFRGVDPTYIRQFFTGLREGLKSGSSLAWSAIVNLGTWVVALPQEPENNSRPHEDRDPGWGWARRELASLISAGLVEGPEEIPFHLRENVWSLLRPLTDDPDPSPTTESRDSDSIENDLLAHSHVCTRSEAMHALVRFALWVDRHFITSKGEGTLPRRGFHHMPEAREQIEKHLKPCHDPALAIRAVFGEWLPELVRLDREWVSQNIKHFFPEEAGWSLQRDTTWAAYLAANDPRPETVGLLQRQYERAAREKFIAPPRGHRTADPRYRLSEHLMQMYWSGMIELDDPAELLPAFYVNAPAGLKGRALEFVGRSLDASKGELDPEVKHRLMLMWDQRFAAHRNTGPTGDAVDELKYFGWWFASRKLDEVWVISRLVSTLSVVGTLAPEFMVLTALAELAEAHPRPAVDALTLIVESDRKGWSMVASQGAITTILNSVLVCADSAAVADARRLVDLLGAKGHREFRHLLER